MGRSKRDTIDVALESEAVKEHILVAEHMLKTIYHRSQQQINEIYADADRIADAAIAKLKPGQPVDARDGVMLSVAYSEYLNYACTYFKMFSKIGKTTSLPPLTEPVINRFVSVFYGAIIPGDSKSPLLDVSSEKDGAVPVEGIFPYD